MSRLGSGAGAVLSVGIAEAVARCGIVATPMDRRGSPIDDSFAGKAVASAGEAGCWYVCTGEEAITKRPGEQAKMDEAARGFSQCYWLGHAIELLCCPMLVGTIVQLPR